MLLMVLIWLLVALFVGMAVYGIRKDEDGYIVFGMTFSICLGLAALITTVIIPLGNEGRLQEMRAFQDANARNYQVTATKSELILSEQQFVIQALIPVEGSIEKMNVGTQAIERLVEWRDNTVLYNDDLARFRYFDKHLWVGFYFPDPGDLKFMVIE